MPDMHGDCPAMRGFVTCQYDLKTSESDTNLSKMDEK